MRKIIEWLDEHVTSGWQIGPVQFVVYVVAAFWVGVELIRWL